MDSIGCALGAFNAEPMRGLRRLAAGVSAKEPATVIGTQINSSPELAAFVGGAMIRYADFSDDYFGAKGDAGPHPSDNIASILASTQTAGRDGKALILGIAIAYEVCGQLMDHLRLTALGWDLSVVHAISTSLGGGKVLGLSVDQMRNAVSLAVVPNISLLQTRQGELSNWKGIAGPNGSRSGLFAALLAREGITGPSDPFEGKAGFMKQLDSPFELGEFGGQNVAFKVEGTFYKVFPVIYSAQLMIWTALRLRAKVAIDDIVSVRVYVIGRCAIQRADRPEYWDPRTHETADHSLPYLIAAALVDGEITEKTVTPERFRDPKSLTVIDKISFEEDKSYTRVFPTTFNCRMEATLSSGEKVTIHEINPKGHPSNPLTDKEIESKFIQQAGKAINQKQLRVLLDQLWDLENLDSVDKLFPLMLIQQEP